PEKLRHESLWSKYDHPTALGDLQLTLSGYHATWRPTEQVPERAIGTSVCADAFCALDRTAIGETWRRVGSAYRRELARRGVRAVLRLAHAFRPDVRLPDQPARPAQRSRRALRAHARERCEVHSQRRRGRAVRRHRPRRPATHGRGCVRGKPWTLRRARKLDLAVCGSDVESARETATARWAACELLLVRRQLEAGWLRERRQERAHRIAEGRRGVRAQFDRGAVRELGARLPLERFARRGRAAAGQRSGAGPR